MRLGLCVLLVGLLAAPVSLAQVAGDQEEPDVIEIVEKVTVIVVGEELNVRGEIVKPQLVYGALKGQAQFPLLIEVRQSFLPEVMGTADCL